MGDHNVKIKVGLQAGAVKTGLAEVRGQFRDFKGEIGKSMTGLFSGAVLGAGLIGGISALVAKGSEVNDLSERFGVAADSLQRIGNVAQQNGSGLEGVAAGMNKLVLAQEKVRSGDEAASKAMKTLNIEAKDFINLNPEEAFYKVADGVKNADDRTAAYAAVIALMGRSSGELFTTLEMGGDAIRDLGSSIGVMSNATVAKLDDMGDAYDKLKARMANTFAPLLASIVNGIASVFNLTSHLGEGIGNVLFNRGEGFDDRMKAIYADFQAEQKNIWNPEAKVKGKGPIRDLDESEKGEKTSKLESLKERLAELQRENSNSQLTTEEKINALLEQRAAVLAKINYVSKDAAADNLEAQVKAAEIDKELIAARQKVADDAEKGGKVRNGEVIADRLTKIGLGGGGFLRDSDPSRQSAEALKKIQTDMAKARETLAEIEKKQATWNP
jgi:hypothetical protein